MASSLHTLAFLFKFPFVAQIIVLIKVIDSVPYRPVRSEYTVPANNLVHSTPLFRTGKNTGRTGQFRAILGVPAGKEKSFFFIFFLSFVIFEFLLGQNGNLFALTY